MVGPMDNPYLRQKAVEGMQHSGSKGMGLLIVMMVVILIVIAIGWYMMSKKR